MPSNSVCSSMKQFLTITILIDILMFISLTISLKLWYKFIFSPFNESEQCTKEGESHVINLVVFNFLLLNYPYFSILLFR